MRLPLRHSAALEPAIPQRCLHLEALADACVGLPLSPVADLLLADAGRGRHGNALQWHFGLAARDSAAILDWEDRIEIKLVSIWTRKDGSVTCDKLKVCDVNVDPAHKLNNVLWVFADRMTRVIWATCMTARVGRLHESLVASYQADPHFGDPALFVEARESKEKVAPAYYLSSSWFEQLGILPKVPALVFDSSKWVSMRRDCGDRSPRMLAVDAQQEAVVCPHCREILAIDSSQLQSLGWTFVAHRSPVSLACEGYSTMVFDRTRVAKPRACSVALQHDALAGMLSREQLWRLADEVPEPEDHGH